MDPWSFPTHEGIRLAHGVAVQSFDRKVLSGEKTDERRENRTTAPQNLRSSKNSLSAPVLGPDGLKG